jgi:hypothetical protein
VVYDLVPANTDEREAAETVLDSLCGCQVIGDKGFVGDFWQSLIFDQTGNRIWTPKRNNQYHQNAQAFDQWLNSVRERIEGVFHELTDTGRNLEKLLAKTIVGLATRVIAKLTSHALRHLLRIQFGIKVLSFEISA